MLWTLSAPPYFKILARTLLGGVGDHSAAQIVHELSVSVMEAGVNCTSFLLNTQLEMATGEKEPQLGARTRGLYSNAEFQPCEPPMWP